MSLCVAAAGTTLRLAVAAFTLSWTHSVERVRWEEDWTVGPAGLTIVAARVKGSGAGMEPAPEARLVDGWWRWSPQRKPEQTVVLAASGTTGGGWTLCADGRCRVIGSAAGEPIQLYGCD